VGRITGAALVGGFAASRQENAVGYQEAYLLVAALISLVVMLSAFLQSDSPETVNERAK